MLRIFVFTLVMFATTIAAAQAVEVYIVVTDENNERLQEASVFFSGPKEYRMYTDRKGLAIIGTVPSGVYTLTVQYLGYKTYSSQYTFDNSGGSVTIGVQLSLSPGVDIGQIEVQEVRNRPMNEFTTMSTRSFTPEDTRNVAAAVNDPGRAAMTYAGVQGSRDNRSDIIVRANSPLTLGWRLEGVDLVNPNHFARRGSSGGGITVFSSNVLGTSDFMSGAFPAEYGNALGGLFDIRFRDGNKAERHYKASVGMVGIDLAAEGPFRKGKSSYLVNYRYSTLGILNALGFRLVGPRIGNSFQDLSWHLNYGGDKSEVSFWGISGLSTEIRDAEADTSAWRSYDDRAAYRFQTRMGATGVTYNHYFGSNRLQITAAAMASDVAFRDDTLRSTGQAFTVNDEHYVDGRLTLAASYLSEFHNIPGLRLKTGMQTSWWMNTFYQQEYNYDALAYQQLLDGRMRTLFTDVYAQVSYEHGDWRVTPGLHTSWLLYNNSIAVDPRIAVQYTRGRWGVTLGSGIYSRPLPPAVLAYSQGGADNRDLKMMRSLQGAAGVTYQAGSYRLVMEAYLQHLFNIPVSTTDSTYWFLNEIQGYGNTLMTSDGKGRNTGIEFTVDRPLLKGWMMRVTGTIFRSVFTPLNGEEYPTRFDSRWAGSALCGKDFKLKERSHLMLIAKVLLNGGQRISPLATAVIQQDREPVFDNSRPFANQISAYFRTDIRLAWTLERPRVQWRIAIDVQNFTSRRNADYLNYEWNPVQSTWGERVQGELVPVLSIEASM